jgi:hypothetical protein
VLSEIEPQIKCCIALSVAKGVVTEPVLTVDIGGEVFMFMAGYRRHGFVDSARSASATVRRVG